MKNAFTLLEIIIAIFVITVGIAGVYAVVSRTLSLSYYNSARFLASLLTQEGFEVVRNIRDSNWLGNLAFDTGLDDGDWLVQYNRSQLLPFSDQVLKIDDQGFYNYDSGAETQFKRKVAISHLTSDKIKVKIQVTWPGRGSPFEAQEILQNWR